MNVNKIENKQKLQQHQQQYGRVWVLRHHLLLLSSYKKTKHITNRCNVKKHQKGTSLKWKHVYWLPVYRD